MVLIEGLEHDVRELRSRQSIPRNLSTKAVETSLPGTRDVSGVTVPANSTMSWTIDWVSDGTQDAPVANAAAYVYNGTSLYSPYGVLNSSGAGYTLSQDYKITESLNSIGAQHFAWNLTVYGGSSGISNLSFKASILGSTPGTLTITNA